MQPVSSPDVVLVGFEPESVRFRICVELARIDSGNLRDRTDLSSRIFPSRSEPGSLPNIYAECRLLKPIFSEPILLRVTAATRETDPTDPPECRSAK